MPQHDWYGRKPSDQHPPLPPLTDEFIRNCYDTGSLIPPMDGVEPPFVMTWWKAAAIMASLGLMLAGAFVALHWD
jgi:hypothetical protein